MELIENQTTQKLESYGRARGLHTKIRKIMGRKDGLFFLLALGKTKYSTPKPMGKSILEAELWIESNKPERTSEHFNH